MCGHVSLLQVKMCSEAYRVYNAGLTQSIQLLGSLMLQTTVISFLQVNHLHHCGEKIRTFYIGMDKIEHCCFMLNQIIIINFYETLRYLIDLF